MLGVMCWESRVPVCRVVALLVLVGRDMQQRQRKAVQGRAVQSSAVQWPAAGEFSGAGQLVTATQARTTISAVEQESSILVIAMLKPRQGPSGTLLQRNTKLVLQRRLQLKTCSTVSSACKSAL